MSYFNNVRLTDAAGNNIESHLDADGGYHLGTASTQAVFPDSNNSSVANLDAAGSVLVVYE